MDIDMTGSSRSRKRTRAMADVDCMPSDWNYNHVSKRHKQIEYCYVVQMRQTRYRQGSNKHRWDVIDSFQNITEANQCMVQTLQNIFRVKSEYDINGSKFRKVVEGNSLIRFHDIVPPNSDGVTLDIFAEVHEVKTIVSNER